MNSKVIARMIAIYKEIVSDKGRIVTINDDGTETIRYKCPYQVLEMITSKPQDITCALIAQGYLIRTKVGGFGDGMSEYMVTEKIIDDLIGLDGVESELEAIKIGMKEEQDKYCNVDGIYFGNPYSAKAGKWIINGIDVFGEIERELHETDKGWKSRCKMAHDAIVTVNSGRFSNYRLMCGRDYNTICNLPKEIRSHIKHKSGRTIVECDINAAIPRLLGVAVIRHIEKEYAKNRKRWERRKAFDPMLVRSKEEYEAYKAGKGNRSIEYNTYYINDDGAMNRSKLITIEEAKQWSIDIVDSNDAYMNIAQKFELEVMTRDSIKSAMLPIVFGRKIGDEEIEYRCMISSAMMDLYPNLYGYIKEQAQKYYRKKSKGSNKSELGDSLVYEVFALEGEIIRDALKKFDCVRFGLYDAIFTLDRYSIKVSKAIEESFTTITGLSYKGKVSNTINEVEIYDKLMSKNTKNEFHVIEYKKKKHKIKKSKSKEEIMDWIRVIKNG